MTGKELEKKILDSKFNINSGLDAMCEYATEFANQASEIINTENDEAGVTNLIKADVLRRYADELEKMCSPVAKPVFAMFKKMTTQKIISSDKDWFESIIKGE